MPFVSLFLFVALALYLVVTYNTMVRLRNRFKNSFAQIDVQLERRHDLIPNLVNTAKGYMKHEQDTLRAVIEARNAAQGVQKDAADPQAMAKLSSAESLLSAATTRFMALAENYPDLKANTTMQELMEQLASTENRIAFARQAFNDAVMAYNTSIESFPNNLLSQPFGFVPAVLLEITDAKKRDLIKVDFAE